MRRQRKKNVQFLVIWVLMLGIIFTLIPDWRVADATTKKIVYFGGTAVTLDYAPGGYFTDNGAACKDHSKSGIHSYTRESACNCKCTYKGTVLGAVQCFGYARYIQEKLFGKNSYTNSSSFYHVSGSYVAKGKLTASKLKSIMTSGKVKPGAHLRTNSSGHSMIITQITSNGFSIIQANGSNNDEYSGHYACRIGTHTYTWSSYVSSTYGSRGIKYIEMPYKYTLKDANPCMSGHTWDKGEIVKKATCTEKGKKLYTCTVCGETKTKDIEAIGHKSVDSICSVCGKDLRVDLDDCTIIYSKKVSYTGKEQTPEVTVEYKNKELIKNKDYELDYKDNKDIGTATVTVIGNNDIYIGSVVKKFTIIKGQQTVSVKKTSYNKVYGDKAFALNATTNRDGKISYSSNNKSVATVNSSGKVTLKSYGRAIITVTAKETSNYSKGTKKITITVNPNKMSKPSVKSTSAGKIKISWKKDNMTTGYQIRYSTKSNLSGGKIIQVKGKNTLTTTISKLTKGKKYYIQIRPYKMQGSGKYIGVWSSAVNVTTKK